MGNDAIMGLVKDLTQRLSGVAVEFGDRVEHLEREARQPLAAPRRRALASDLVRQRAVRAAHFPAELFHEPAWDMLLALFIADDDNRPLNIKALVTCTQAPVTTSQRWLDHLHKLNLVHRVIDPADRRRVEVSLSPAAGAAMRDYLDRIAQASRPNRSVLG